MAIPEKIKQLANRVRQEIYGKDVRESIAEGMEETGRVSKESNDRSLDTASRQSNIESRYDVAVGAHTEDSEVIDARVNADGSKTFDNIKQRLDESDKQMTKNIDRLNDNAFSPDDFEGTDFNKMQQAMDRAVETGEGIRLSRMYDITGHGPLYVNKENVHDRRVLSFIGFGGGIEKRDKGHMFTTDKEETDSTGFLIGDLSFINVKFKSMRGQETVILNTDRIIRVDFMNCYFRDVDHIAVCIDRYFQSINIVGGNAVGGNRTLFMTPDVNDFRVANFYAEYRAGGFFEQTGAQRDFKTVSQMRIRDCMMEGIQSKAFIFKNVQSLIIDGTYFEQNWEDEITFDPNAYMRGVNISNNFVILRTAPVNGETVQNTFIKWGGSLHNVTSINNYVTNGPVHDTTNVLPRAFKINSIGDFSLTYDDVDPGNYLRKIATRERSILDAEKVTDIVNFTIAPNTFTDFVTAYDENVPLGTLYSVNMFETTASSMVVNRHEIRDGQIRIRVNNTTNSEQTGRLRVDALIF